MEIYLVEFKGSRKQYFLNPENLQVRPGDFVLVQAERGEDLGRVTKKLGLEDPSKLLEKPLNLLRLSTPEDLQRMKENQERGVKASGGVPEAYSRAEFGDEAGGRGIPV